VVEKHEIEDSLPEIYADVTGTAYPGSRLDDGTRFGVEDLQLLREICGDPLHFELTRQLISIERNHRFMARRAGVFQELERAIERGFYDNAEDATERARQRLAAKRRGTESVEGDAA
jgi:DNA sulfur modification protein DndC